MPPPASSADRETASDHEDEAATASQPSSYYFFKSTPQEQAAKFAPQRVDAKQAAAPEAPSDGTSVWNRGNTWEERDLTRWATDTIKELLSAVPIEAAGEDSIQISSVDTPKCHASIVFVRGKKRHGFDLSVEVKWAGQLGGKKVNGKIEFSEVADDCDDDDFPVSVSASENDKEHDCARMGVRKALPKFQAKLREFENLLRQK
ncbi:hypothetical protein PBRA_006999 [Plasmodiophora brassicae]|nr:hypothetical protein PBRA_006999 [Plasmodiophora brassicae]